MQQQYRPGPVGLYDPRDERDACGFGLIAQLDDAPSRAIVDRAIEALVRMTHRGGIAADGLSGDGHVRDVVEVVIAGRGLVRTRIRTASSGGGRG